MQEIQRFRGSYMVHEPLCRRKIMFLELKGKCENALGFVYTGEKATWKNHSSKHVWSCPKMILYFLHYFKNTVDSSRLHPDWTVIWMLTCTRAWRALELMRQALGLSRRICPWEHGQSEHLKCGLVPATCSFWPYAIHSNPPDLNPQGIVC